MSCLIRELLLLMILTPPVTSSYTNNRFETSLNRF